MKTKHVLLAAALASASPLCSAKNIHSYQELASALKSGATVKAIIDVEKCHYLNGSNDLDEKTRGARFNDIYERITTDLTSGTKMRVIATGEFGYFPYDRKSLTMVRSLFRVFENGTAEQIDIVADPVTFKIISMKVLVCKLSADDSGGVTLITK